MNIRNNRAFLLLAAFVLSTMSLHAYNHTAVSPSGDTLCYNIFDGHAALTYRYYDVAAYTNLSDTVIIPSSVEYNGSYYSVTSIEDRAFYGCSMVTKFILPNTLTSIGSNAFRNCSGLTSIDIPSSVTLIGFATFRNCTSLTSISIPYGLSDIDGQMFYDCINLESVTIPSSVTWIYSGAFYNCTKLISLNIPSSVAIIDADAFYLVKNIVYNGSALGSPWGALTHNGTFEGDFIYSNSAKTHLTAYIGNSTEASIPSGVQTIRQYAFANSSNLRKVNLPSSLTTIYSYAFSYSGLNSIVIPNSVTSIKSYAFFGCQNLVSLTLGYGLTSINDWAFERCTSLDSIAIPYSVTSIGYGSFHRCTGLTKVEPPPTLTAIGPYAFYRCTALQEITIPSLVTSIGDNAFANCTALTTVNMLPNNPPSISGSTFTNNAAGRIFMLSCGSLDAYLNNSSWSAYSGDLRDRPDFSVTLTPNIPDAGIAQIVLQGGYVMGCDSSASIMAAPNEGYYFVAWSDGDSNMTRTIWLSGDTAITAIFQPYVYTLSLQSNDTTMGTVSGAGDYYYHDTVVISAHPLPHHQFTHWSNGNTHANDTLVITGDLSLTAFFTTNIYTVTVQSDNPEMGTVEGGGYFLYGDSCTATATAAEGYIFLRWSDGSLHTPYTFLVDRDTILTAYFGEESHTITVTTLTNDTAMGHVVGGGPYEIGTQVSLHAVAHDGYRFEQWTDGATTNPRIITAETDTTFTAIFAQLPVYYTITVLSDNPDMGAVSGGGQYIQDTTVIIEAHPRDGYRFERWNDNNTDNPRNITVSADATYTAYFTPVDEPQGILSAEEQSLRVYTDREGIVIETAGGRAVRVYDISGRLLAEGSTDMHIAVPTAGVYIVRASGLAARKVVVTK